ncbi:copper transporter 6-like [Iris pallida]|uniref:Copper transport protein n=1 Tax=Iris pallida TaxID=29817 RepID=A0AAX6GQK5_IRIPA|nr:copper transporter 6-like [Iris pallida]
MNMGGGGGGDGHDMGMTMPPPSSTAGGGMHGGGMGMGMGTMHMTFFWGHRVDILFSGWPGGRRHGVGMYLLALLFVFALSALVELLSYLPRLAAVGGGGGGGGLVLTGIATLRTGLSYLVMLAVMSFNAGVLIAAVLGHAVGYYVFGSGAVLGRGRRKEQAPAPAQEEETLQHKC